MIRVALADDQELVRAGFAALLDAEDDIEVAGEAADGQQAVRIAEQCRPDVMLMDIRMPVLDGIEAIRRIASRPEFTSVHVIIHLDGNQLGMLAGGGLILLGGFAASGVLRTPPGTLGGLEAEAPGL